MAAAAMHSESARSDAGFDNLPHIGAAGDEQPLYDDWDTDDNDPVHPPLTNPSRREGQFEKVTYPPHNQAPIPPTAGTTPPSRTPLSDASIAALRLCLPNLKGLDDNVFRTTNIEVLIQLNGAAQTPDRVPMPSLRRHWRRRRPPILHSPPTEVWIQV